MPRESKASKRKRAAEVCRRMNELYPYAQPALHFSDPFQCVISVALSAQTTDANVNKVTPELFKRWGTPQKMAGADVVEIERVIYPIGFYHNKAKNCVGCAQMIMSDFCGKVPRTMAELEKLPGVGRKTANIVLNESFGIVEGIAVDTHVNRIAHKLKFTNAKDVKGTEADLLDLLDPALWRNVNRQWILFGRQYCIARRPCCQTCPLADLCPSA